MAWTLSNIRSKVRNLTGRKSTNQLSNASILTYINDFYQEVLISELNLLELEDWYDFNTTVNDETYSIATTSYFTVKTPCYVNDDEVDFYVDSDSFYSKYPRTIDVQDVGDGDGSTTAFTATLNNTPIKAGTVVVDDRTETFSDDGAGTLTGDAGGSGTINYTTGALSVTFNTAPTDGLDIRTTYEYWSTGTPVALLWDSANSQVILAPTPDEVYKIRVRVSKVPSVFSADGDAPVYDDWGPVIAYGAAREILSDYDGPDVAARLYPEYKKHLNFAGRRFIRQYEGVRAEPKF
jgi:hypothetical protein